MIQCLISAVKQIVSKKEYKSLQGLLLSHIKDNTPATVLPEIWESIEYLTRPTIKLTEHASALSILITNYLLEYKYNKEVLDHLRKIGHLIDADRSFRQRIIQVYKSQYADVANLDIFIRLSGIDENTHLSTGVSTLDKLINLSVGKPAYSSRFGYGEVIKIDFLLDSITLNFFANQTQSFTIEQALKSLQLIPPDNFEYLKQKNRLLIAEMIHNSPQALERILKQHINCSGVIYHTYSRINATATISTIKKILSGVVADDDIKSFIEYIKKNKPRTANSGKRTADHGIDYSLLPSMSADSIIKLFDNISSSAKQKLIIELKKRPDWLELFSVIFFSQVNKQVLLTILSQLNTEQQNEFILKTFIEYKRYPAQFLTLAELKIEKDARLVLTRYLDIATVLHTKQFNSEIRKRIIANNYKLLKTSLTQITKDSAKRTLERIQAIKNLYPEERDDIQKIFKAVFPELTSEETEYIYNTETAIKNKTAELQKLISEEMPKVANEIAHARSYGDLRENFEFKAAKEKQKRLLAHISQIRHGLSKARPIDFNNIDISKVTIGTTVKLLAIKENNQSLCEGLPSPEYEVGKPLPQLQYTILGPWDSDVSKGIISYFSPFAQTLLNKKVGDETTDMESKIYKIIEITKIRI